MKTISNREKLQESVQNTLLGKLNESNSVNTVSDNDIEWAIKKQIANNRGIFTNDSIYDVIERLNGTEDELYDRVSKIADEKAGEFIKDYRDELETVSQAEEEFELANDLDTITIAIKNAVASDKITDRDLDWLLWDYAVPKLNEYCGIDVVALAEDVEMDAYEYIIRRFVDDEDLSDAKPKVRKRSYKTENKTVKTEGYISAAPFRELMYDAWKMDFEDADTMLERMLSAWSDDDCKWYCETYELVTPHNDYHDEEAYYEDVMGNIRDISGQIVDDEEN